MQALQEHSGTARPVCVQIVILSIPQQTTKRDHGNCAVSRKTRFCGGNTDFRPPPAPAAKIAPVAEDAKKKNAKKPGAKKKRAKTQAAKKPALAPDGQPTDESAP